MQATMPAAAPKQKIVAFLLAFFLGGFGVHNFYLGKTGMGVTQLLVTVTITVVGAIVIGPWALIQSIMIMGEASTTPTATPWSEVDRTDLIHLRVMGVSQVS